MSKTRTWKIMYRIPQYLVQDITDAGMVEFYYPDEEHPETDDLRIAIMLSGGTKIVLDALSRIILTEKELLIEVLVPAEPDMVGEEHE